MKEFQFERKQRFFFEKIYKEKAAFFFEKIYNRSLFGLARNEFIFCWYGAQPVQATETTSTLISSHYLDEQDLPEKLKSELQWFEENKIEDKREKNTILSIENWLQDYQKQVCFLMMRCLSWEQDYYCFPSL